MYICIIYFLFIYSSKSPQHVESLLHMELRLSKVCYMVPTVCYVDSYVYSYNAKNSWVI